MNSCGRESTCSSSTCFPTPRDPQGIHKAIWEEILRRTVRVAAC